MTGFDYGNARLRAMKSRLLSQAELAKMADAGSIQALITELGRSSMHGAIESALSRTSGLPCIRLAIRLEMNATVGKIHSFYRDDAGDLLAILLRANDVQNLKAVLRGLSRRATPTEIEDALVPAAAIGYETLAVLAQAALPRAAIDSMASMGLPFAAPLLQLRIERPGAGTGEMELRLDQWYFRSSLSQLVAEKPGGGTLFRAIQIDADIANLMTAFRLAQDRQERASMARSLGSSEVIEVLVGPGRLSFQRLVEAAAYETVDAAIQALGETPYQTAIEAGQRRYQVTGRLSSVEAELLRWRRHWRVSLIAKEPLGIGVVLGYIALKEAEVGKLRWIANGIHLGMDARLIKEGMDEV